MANHRTDNVSSPTPSVQQHPSAQPTWQQQVQYAAGLTLEIVLMLAHWAAITMCGIYRLFVPKAERSVAGEIVLVTGSGHGIGREIALQYGRLGARIVCVDINDATNAETVQMVRADGGEAYAFVCDVTDREAVHSLIERIRRDIGTVDILVNNAGIMPCRPLLQQTESEIRRTFDVNVFAHFWLLQAIVPDMVAAGKGHVVALSSIAGIGGLSNLVPYCGTKFAVRGLMEALSEELRQTMADKIKFTTIYPYMTDTGMCARPYIRFGGLLPLLRPNDVARILVSAQRRDIVGCTVPLTMLYAETVLRLFPSRVGQSMADFMRSGVNAVE